MYHLFLRLYHLFLHLENSDNCAHLTDHCKVSMQECLCFVNCKTPRKYKIWMSPSPRMPWFHVGPFLSPLLSFKSGFPPHVWFALCPFPAFPYYKENWHSGPCPLCQLAKSLQGSCSVSDITTKISPGFQRGALSCPPYLPGNGLLVPPWHAMPPTSFWSRQVIHCWVCQWEHPLIPPSLPVCLSFSPFLPIWPMKV